MSSLSDHDAQSFSNSFEGVLGVVRKSRGVLFFRDFFAFVWPNFQSILRGYMRSPPPLSPPCVHLCIRFWPKFVRINYWPIRSIGVNHNIFENLKWVVFFVCSSSPSNSSGPSCRRKLKTKSRFWNTTFEPGMFFRSVTVALQLINPANDFLYQF